MGIKYMQFQINIAGLRCRLPETFEECQSTPCIECIMGQTFATCKLRLKLYKAEL
jgi:hypothetical protein